MKTNKISTQSSFTYHGNKETNDPNRKPYKVVFTGNFFNGEYDGIEDIIFYDDVDTYIDITDFIFDFFPFEGFSIIDDIEQKIIDNY
jgi:hypothetical protein